MGEKPNPRPPQSQAASGDKLGKKEKNMTATQVRKALKNVEYGEEFEATLKTGETVVCKCDPKKTECEAAYQQTLNKETLYRGDILKAKEIAFL